MNPRRIHSMCWTRKQPIFVNLATFPRWLLSPPSNNPNRIKYRRFHFTVEYGIELFREILSAREVIVNTWNRNSRALKSSVLFIASLILVSASFRNEFMRDWKEGSSLYALSVKLALWPLENTLTSVANFIATFWVLDKILMGGWFGSFTHFVFHLKYIYFVRICWYITQINLC